MEGTTIHKLSYLPVCPPIKEELPWAKRLAIAVSDVPVEQSTTYKLSYIPNNATHKPTPIKIKDNAALVTNSASFDDHTVYKESFFGPGGYYKRQAILPTLQLQKSDAKMNTDSVYNLSYPRHSDVQKRVPISQQSRFLLGSGSLDDLTTQRRDFVDKPLCRRDAILPIGQMEKIEAPFEEQTTMKLSYMEPNAISRSTPYRPKDAVTSPNGNLFPTSTSYTSTLDLSFEIAPMDDKTIHKLSFIPIPPPMKEEYPWAQRKVHSTGLPMDLNTIQNLSFLPPGEMIEVENGCNCSHSGECMSNTFPKADSF